MDTLDQKLVAAFEGRIVRKDLLHRIKKGTKFDARAVRLDGLVIVLGFGANEVIPHNYLGKYERTTVTVKSLFDGRNGFETVRKAVTKDVTNDYVAFWKKEAAKKAAVEARVDRINTKNRIAAIRKTIKFVKTGKAEKELALLLNHLDTVA